MAVLVVGLFAIYKWQTAFLDTTVPISSAFKITAARGIYLEKEFVFFLHHLNLYPVATDAPIRADTADEARRILHELPQSLMQDHYATYRSGDYGRTYLYLFDVWLHHDSIKPSLVPAHALAFIVALLGVFAAFWAIGKALWGAVLCVFIGSNPVQLYAVYREENIVSWPITAMALLLALSVPVMWPKRPSWYPWVCAIGSGVLVALIRNIRSEPVPILLSAAVVLATAAGIARRKRIILVGAVVASFAVTSWASVGYLKGKLYESMAVVKDVGGSPYAAPINAYHEFWHPIACGLGDFDTKYGYQWNDIVTYGFAWPELHEKYPDLVYDKRPGGPQPRSWDAAGKYPYYFAETPGYHDIIRRKVLGDIERDPKWYLTILDKRAWRILTDTTPLGLTTTESDYKIGGAFLGLACVPLAIFLALARRWFLLKLLLFSVPLSINPFLIHSGHGQCWFSMFHVFGAFILGLLVWDGAKRWLRERHVREAPSASLP